MNLSNFYEAVKNLLKVALIQRKDIDKLTVCIRTIDSHHIGGSHTTNIDSISIGFDWDKNKVIIYPKVNLYELSGIVNLKLDAFVDARNIELKEEVRKLKSVNDDLRAQLEQWV